MISSRYAVAAVLLQLVSFASTHGTGGHIDTDNNYTKTSEANRTLLEDQINVYNLPSYAGYNIHKNLILAHIVLMVLAWVFALPIGVVFSIVRSRFALSVQFSFIFLNGVGVLFGALYNSRTPDLYVNNAHHKIGWISTWVVVAQVMMALLLNCSQKAKQPAIHTNECTGFLTLSIENVAQSDIALDTDCHQISDSDMGTDRSSTLNSPCDISPNALHRQNTLGDLERIKLLEPEDEEDDEGEPAGLQHRLRSGSRSGRLHLGFIDKCVCIKVPTTLSIKTLRIVRVLSEVINRTILVFGFVALTSGGVTYSGIFRGNNVFNGLAHFIKGGIFFWYGLLTLGRWMGCFADLGWAWNIKPTRGEVGKWKAAMPSAEFVESSVIWLYGALNMWLEHLAAWGGEWTAQDLEHISISIMFFSGGLCGILVEWKFVRHCLDTTVANIPTQSEVHRGENHEQRAYPKQHNPSLNPMPALVIFLLGITMSSHHHSSLVSTTVHAQWGNLLAGFSLSRFLTYVLMYISPPTSVYGSRPPTELVSSFCLVSGGLVLMASNKDIIFYMERADLMAMFVFSVTMGITAFIMAYAVIVLSFKGWAAQKEMKSPSNDNSAQY